MSLSWLTKSALVYEPKCKGKWGVVGSQPMSTAVHRSQINFGDLTPYLTYGFHNLWEYLSPELQRYVDKEKQQVSHGQAGQKQAEIKLVNFMMWTKRKRDEKLMQEGGYMCPCWLGTGWYNCGQGLIRGEGHCYCCCKGKEYTCWSKPNGQDLPSSQNEGKIPSSP